MLRNCNLPGTGQTRRGLVACLAMLVLAFATTAKADPVLSSDGYYEIATYDDLLWFAEQLDRDNSINGRLTGDIEIEDEYWKPMGTLTKPYKGKFDGSSGNISNLVLNLQTGTACGLFGYADGATITGVYIDEVRLYNSAKSSPLSFYGVGTVCGVAKNGTTVKGCVVNFVAIDMAGHSKYADINSVGGVVGYCESSSVKFCRAGGSILTNSQYVGGVVGRASSSEITDCKLVNYGTMVSKVQASRYAGGIVGLVEERSAENTVSNCFVENGVTVTATGDSTLCDTLCGGEAFSSNPRRATDGWFEIYTAAQLHAFSQLVNSSEESTGLMARLMRDIDLSGGTFTPIGKKSKPFKGQLDGQGHAISGLQVADQECAGLVGSMAGGAVRSLRLYRPTLSNSSSYAGFVAGYMTVSGTDSCVVAGCEVQDGQLTDGGGGTRSYVGGVVGRADGGARVEECLFRGTVAATSASYVGGIAGCIDSGAALMRCYTVGESSVSGYSKVGGIVGSIEGSGTTLTDCFVDRESGNVTVYTNGVATPDAIIFAENISGTTNDSKTYTENGLVYALTGATVKTEDGGTASVAKVTGVADNSQTSFHVVNDIGSWYDYQTTYIEDIKGAEELDFIDNNSTMPWAKASNWIGITIKDYAFGSSFKSLYMRYTVYGAGYVVGSGNAMMLRPTDVKPAGKAMFANCPNAKVYVDAEYYEEFCNDPNWKEYKKHLVPVTWMRGGTDFTEYGAKYQYDRNHNAAADIVKKKGYGNTDVYMLHIIGADNDKINSQGGTLTVYKDIGETYAYNTTKIWASSFKGNTSVKRVKFEEIMSNASDTYYDLGIAIGDSAFAGCTNLETFDVVLSSDEGKDHYEAILPSQMPIGKGVFAGCPEGFRIRVQKTVYDEFVYDKTYGWGEYKDLIEATDFNWTNFTEKGVTYSYYTSDDGQTRYTNKDTQAMENVVKPWVGLYRDFTSESVLCPNASEKVYYLKASGVVDSDIDKNSGELRIFNDIGTSTDYKTIELSSTGFQNNTHIKSICFEDCASNVSNSNTNLGLVIPSGTFKGCTNLKTLNMFYYVTDGTNHYEGIKPSEIFIGENVFEGVDPSFRINVLPDFYEDFINDGNWSQYKDIIVAADYLPTNNKPFTEGGITYDYAAKSLNTTTTSEIVRQQGSYWNIPIIIAEVIMAVATVEQYALSFSQKTIEAGAAAENTRLEQLLTQSYNQEVAGANKAATAAKSAVYNSNMGGLEQIQQLDVIADKLKKAKAAARANWIRFGNQLQGWAVQQGIRNQIAHSFVVRAYLGAGSAAATYATNYLIQRATKNFERGDTWYMNDAFFITSKNRTSVPQVYIKSADNDASEVTIYADPGGTDTSHDTDHFRTVGVGPEAFRNKTNLKKIQFQGRKDDTEILFPMVLAMPDSCFAGCKLEELNLVLKCKYKSRRKALTPDNFILAGDIFAGCDTTNLTIKVGSEVYDQFVEDEYWSKYKGRFKAETVEEVKDNDEWSCLYSLAYDTNTMPLVSQVENQNIKHVYIYGANNKHLSGDNKGLAALINDYGLVYNYKLDYVKAKAFYGNTNLKILDITDSHSFIGDVYTGFSVHLQDSAFAKCPNFRDLNLIYQVTDGSNNLQPIKPSQVTLGKGVFAGCDNLRIKFCLDQEVEFLADSTWAAYKSKFAPCFFKPMDEAVGDLLLREYRFETDLDDETLWEYVDATRATPEGLKDRFKDTDIESFDEFRAFGSCGLDTVYSQMFIRCKKLQSIQLPDSLRSIGEMAFLGDDLLTRLTIPSKVTDIGQHAFFNTKIKEFTFLNPVPADIEEDKVFYGLPADYVIYVQDSVVDRYKEKWTKVADHINAVSKRRSLVVVTLDTPGTLASKLGFNYNTSEHTVSGNYAQYDSLRIIGTLNGSDLAVIRCMGGCDIKKWKSTVGHLEYLDLYEANIKADSSNPFNCQDVFTNDYITKDNCVESGLFFDLDRIKTLILPKTVTLIRENAIDNCDNLETIVVGDDTKDIEKSQALNCPNVQTLVMLPSSKPNTVERAWTATGTNGVADGQFSTLYTSRGAAGDYSGDIAYYTNVDSIAYAFHDDAVFEAMKQKHVFTPEDLVSISDIEGYVNGNTSIRLFNELAYTSVTTLGNNSLTNMSGLKEVSLPLTLDTITVDAFRGCKSLQKVWALSNVCPGLAQDAFVDLPDNFVILVVKGYEDMYRQAWPQYADRIQGFRSSRVKIREVTLEQPNTLDQALGLKVEMKDDNYIKTISGDMSAITGLKVNGPIGGKDIALIRMLGGREPDWNDQVYTTNLKYLDLYNAEIRKDSKPIYFTTRFINRYVKEDNVVPTDMLWKCDNIETVILPRTATKINDEACYDMYSLKTLVIGDNTSNIDGNDAFGECDNLTTMIFLCNQKPKLHNDAFSDPIRGDKFKVANMYVRKDIINDYTNDEEYTTHANAIQSKFSDDTVFRAYGCKGIATEDDLASVDSVYGWFNLFPELTDLSSLSKTAITDLRGDEFSQLAKLRRVSLPATLSEIGDGAFANNTVLAWADLSACDSLKIGSDQFGIVPEALVYVPASFGTSTKDNIVYGTENALECARYNLPADRDYDVPKAFTAQKVSFIRAFKGGEYTTVTLPFNTAEPAGAKFYLLNSDNDDEKIHFNRKASVQANYPYVVWTEKDLASLDIDAATAIPVTPMRSTSITDKNHNMFGTLSAIDNASAKAAKALVMNETTAIWNPLADDDTEPLPPYSAYTLMKNATASATDVLSVFFDASDGYHERLRAIITANIGDGAFKYPQASIDAIVNSINAESSGTDVEAAAAKLENLDYTVPETETRHALVLGNGKVLAYNFTDDNDYCVGFDNAVTPRYAQAFAFAPTTKAGTFLVYQTDRDGNDRYLCLGSNATISTTTVGRSALQARIDVPKQGDEGLRICDADGNAYGYAGGSLAKATDAADNTFAAQEAEKVSGKRTLAADGWYTWIAPATVAGWDQSLDAYKATSISGNVVTFDRFSGSVLPAATPMLIHVRRDADLDGGTFAYEGYGAAPGRDEFSDGLLRGTLVARKLTAADNAWALQNQGNGASFYPVKREVTMPAERVWLTVPFESNVKSLSFVITDGEATSIVTPGDDAPEAVSGVYGVSGAQLNSLQKGINIIRLSDGTVRKVMVK